MSQPDVAADVTACCPDAYYCPAVKETECPRHGGFDVCCDRVGEHVPMNLDAWHLAQARLEERWLNEMFQQVRAG